MRLSDILTTDRIVVDDDGGVVPDKAAALRLLAGMLGPAVAVEPARVETLLIERERLQSTGIGDGVAIPHATADTAAGHAAALLLCPSGVDFEAIDGAVVSIIFGVVAPKRSAGDHLKVLARISRLLRNERARVELVRSVSPGSALSFIESQENGMR
jgi:PTS system nitrogen regulatory IIA component